MDEFHHLRKINLPDKSEALEAHLWEHLRSPHAAEVGQDVREWVSKGVGPVLVVSGNILEVVVPQATGPAIDKWQFRSDLAARAFAEMMLPYSTVFGLM